MLQIKENNNNNFLIGGVDEAGRGSIIGPLVIAGISVRKARIPELRRIGVRDSKRLTPKARAKLFLLLRDIADFLCIHRIDCTIVDDYVFLKKLNKLEAKAMANVIDNIHADKVYVDSCDIDPLRYKRYIESHLVSSSNLKLYSMHHADHLNVVVSAASIIAKITRDQEIQEIRKAYHDVGSGYPSDKKTMQFIRVWVSRYKFAPQFARCSWRPLRDMLEGMAQHKVAQFG